MGASGKFLIEKYPKKYPFGKNLRHENISHKKSPSSKNIPDIFFGGIFFRHGIFFEGIFFYLDNFPIWEIFQLKKFSNLRNFSTWDILQ